MNKYNFLKNFEMDRIIYLLIVLLPISLVSGPFLSDLSITIIASCFIYISFKKKIFFYYNNIYSKIFICFYALIIILSFFSYDPLISLKKTIPFFRFWLFSLAVWYTFQNKKNIIKHLIFSFSFIFIILIFDGYVQFFFKENIFGWSMETSRVSSLFKDELILGSYLSRMLPIYFGLLIFSNFEKKFKYYFLFFLIFIGMETLIFLSGERVAFFYLNLSTLILILTMKKFKLFRTLTLAVSIFLIFIISNLYPKSTDRILNKTIDQIGIFDNEKYIFSEEHQNHFISGIRMFKDNIIFGTGPRMFRELCGEKKYNLWEGCSTHPHNTYVQLLAETGIFGFLFVATLFFLVIFYLIKHFILKYFFQKNYFTDFQLCLLSAMLISIWPFSPTGGVFNNWLNIIYFFPLGFFMQSLNLKISAIPHSNKGALN